MEIKYNMIRRLLLQSKDLFLVQLVWVIWFLIKNKGHFEINMNKYDFTPDYYVDRDDYDNIIKTDFFSLIADIFWYN